MFCHRLSLAILALLAMLSVPAAAQAPPTWAQVLVGINLFMSGVALVMPAIACRNV